MLFRFFPFLIWLKGYQISSFRSDVLAGLTVAVVLIPQSMAYAMLAGMPPVYGLYAATIAPFIAALWGSLRQLATGPIAIMSLLVLTTLTPPHSFRACKSIACSAYPDVCRGSRCLRYYLWHPKVPKDFPLTFLVAQEKGVDIRLALDIVRLAGHNAYDVALIFSGAVWSLGDSGRIRQE